MNNISLSGNNLTLKEINQILKNPKIRINLTEESIEAVKLSRKRIEDIIQRGEVVYGVTTGFGRFSETVINNDDINLLQSNLIKSHACGMGDYLSSDIVKLAMILRVNSLAKGHSGIKLNTLNKLIELINNNIIPVVPSQGSLGASGDLAPLSHIALVLIGEGFAYDNEKIVSANEILKKNNIEPIVLGAKEGLALINGTQITLSILISAFMKALNVLKVGDICAAMSLEASQGTPDAFDEDIHKLRPHRGQIKTAKNVQKIISDSNLVINYSQGGKVQDAYSLRCVPQVHGASKDALHFIENVIEIEINSVTDNPLIFEDKVLSGGNFHAQYLGIASDTLKVAMAEIGNISERRVERLLNPSISDLNPFFANKPGVESGFMIAQYTAAAIVSENKALSHPATVDSIPVSGNQEDHCSMAPIAARKALEIINNVEKILAIELMVVSQALDLRGIDKASKSSKQVVNLIRKDVPKLKNDRILFLDMKKIRELINNGNIVETVESITGELY